MQQLLEMPQQAPPDDIDEEILEIFEEEVKEVLTEMSSNFREWKNHSENQEALKTLRRNFHTLKGSGRLVGAMSIGELGWRFENLLNRVLDGNMPRSEVMFSLIDRVEKILPSMVEQFRKHQPTPYEVILLISQAYTLTETKGQSLGEFPTASDGVTSGIPETTSESGLTTVRKLSNLDPVKPILVVVEEEDEDAWMAAAMEEEEQKAWAEDTSSEVTTSDLAASDLTTSDLTTFEKLSNLNESDLTTSDLTTSDLTTFEKLSNLNEADLTTSDLTTSDLTTSDLTTFEKLSNLSDFQLADLPTSENLADDLTAAEFSTEFTTDNFQLGELTGVDEMEMELIPYPDHDELTSTESALTPVITELEALPEDSLPGITYDDEITAPSQLATEELELPEFTPTESNLPENLDPKLFAIFQKESKQHLAELTEALNRYEQTLPAKIDQDLMRGFHTLHGSSLSVGFTKIAGIAAPVEGYIKAILERQIELPADKLTIFRSAIAMIKQLLAGQTVEEENQQTLLDQVQMAEEALPLIPKIVSKPQTDNPALEPIVPDATDEFMAIFLDEAEEILENTQSLVERWKTSPHNMQLLKELQRELHTLKGGARMVGIVAMGDLGHSLESVLTKIVEGGAQSNAKLQEVVQNSIDELAAMLEAVRSGVPLEVPTDLIAQILSALTPDGHDYLEPVKIVVPPPPDDLRPKELGRVVDGEALKLDKITDKDGDLGEAGEDRIRVRVAIIDKLTNLTGELSISRAHMEQQQGAVKSNLTEMEQTVTRLREQLRRLEIETETQILSQVHGGPFLGTGLQVVDHKKGDFDPLELDRFSVMQQLSRSLMETTNDLLNIQDFLKTLTRQLDTLLIQQTRMGAELQDAIMRTRMIPFSRISPRLQRIARLTARELRKQVEFIINGETVEFERTVLNRIVAPLEHMLRNAISHGVEDAATRSQAGKLPTAKITIDISKEGTELILKVSDDGAGLNLPAIRRKAEDRALIKPGSVISDYDLMQFILEPSFSTATVITQISGRGVGMDVVNTELKQLGGSLHIFSKMGQGSTFDIRLPLSLTINQALLVHVGEETLAIPMNNVEAVMRAPRAEVLSDSNESRYYKYMGHDYRVYQLGESLGFGKLTLDHPLIPTLLIRAGDRRVALLVDNIEGSKEIVVKSVGPQIGAIRWITGATILGDGRVVLILDMPALTRMDKEFQYTPPPPVVPVILAKTIMVVDDSITVRKVTARLLKRQGMEVITAKDGVDAIAQLQEHIPDLMLLDVEMPRMDGYELATQIRNTPEWKQIPIIMITSRTGTKHRDRAEKIGIDRYLGKPFNETELLENINALLNDGGFDDFSKVVKAQGVQV